MAEMIEVYCNNTNSKILVPFGLSLKEIERYAGVKSKWPVLGAYVNNKVQNLRYEVFMPKTIEFFDITNPSAGRRMYALSLIFIMYKAIKELFADGSLSVHHSMTNGYYVQVSIGGKVDNSCVKEIKACMAEIVAKDIPFERKLMSSKEAVKMFRNVGLDAKATLLENNKKLYVDVDFLGDTVDYFYTPLAYSTGLMNVFDLVAFDKGMLLVMPDKKNPTHLCSVHKKQDKMFSVFREYEQWVQILGTSYVSDLNKAVEEKRDNQLIQVSEALHEKRYAQIADEIFEKKDNVKVVLLAGPSSSGKTTSCRRIATQLAVLGFRPIQLSLDDYFLDREYTPKKANGDYDFECLEALDIDLFNSQMQDLMHDKEVLLPHYDFIKGKKVYGKDKIKSQKNVIFIVEGIHALNPKLSESIAQENKYNIFVSALTQVSIDKHNLISSSDNRLIRRIVRDYNYRGYNALNTLKRWQSVREGEEKHIFPYQENADSIFNSSLLYEIGVLKTYAKPLLSEVPQNELCYAEAKRLIAFLDNFKTISDKSIPPTSIMREFLGGSSFEY